MKKEFGLFLICLLFTLNLAQAATAGPRFCEDKLEVQRQKSAELQRIVQEDQADRAKPYDQIDWPYVQARDLQRRIQVATIFAEGYFREARDYEAAALVYQHGTVPDHFYQTFIWANTAVRMGSSSAKSLVAVAIDRYLVNIGQKQLFGSQFDKDAQGLWCIDAVEETFPDSLRLEYRKLTLRAEIEFFLKYYKSAQTVDQVKACAGDLKDTPAGFVPGFW